MSASVCDRLLRLCHLTGTGQAPLDTTQQLSRTVSCHPEIAQLKKVCSRSLLTAAECWQADNFCSLKKNHFLSGPASGPYHWLLPSACWLGKHFFRAHKNLCFVVDFFLLFFTSQLINEKVFLASQFRCQCRSIMKQNSVDALWTFPPATTEFVNLIRRPPCLNIACLFLCVYGFFFRSISCNRNLYCNHTRPIFKKYPVELYAYTTMDTQT